MRYCVNYLDVVTDEVVHQAFVDDLTNLEDPDKHSKHDQDPSFEVVKSVFTSHKKDAKQRDNKQTEDDEALPPTTLGLSEPKYSMRIHSTAILNALHSVVKYYPSESLVGNPVTLQWPYAILCHHYEELVRFSSFCRDGDPLILCKLEQNGSSHIDDQLS